MLDENSLRNETGNYFGGCSEPQGLNRESWRENREFYLAKLKSSTDEVFGTHRHYLLFKDVQVTKSRTMHKARSLSGVLALCF